MEIAISGLVGFLIGGFFFGLGARNLRKETEKLRHLNIVLMEGLQNAGLLELSKNEQGEITGTIFHMETEMPGDD